MITRKRSFFVRAWNRFIWRPFVSLTLWAERTYPRSFPNAPAAVRLSGEEQLRQIRESAGGQLEIIGVQVVAYDGSCPVCKGMAGRFHRLEKAPPIPIAGCPFGAECTAIYAPVVNYPLYKVGLVLQRDPDIRARELRRQLEKEWTAEEYERHTDSLKAGQADPESSDSLLDAELTEARTSEEGAQKK